MSNAKVYVDADSLKLTAELTRFAKEGSYARLSLQPGQYVLDVAS